MSKSRNCPDCGREMFFTGDGRALVCDVCGHRQEIKRRRRTPQELAANQIFDEEYGDDPASFRSNARDLLGQGVAAAKAGDVDEALFYLGWVLRTDSSAKEQAQAWLWLSQVYEELADKRFCLEQALALEPTNAPARRGLAILDGRLRQEEVINPDELKPTASDAPEEAQAKQFLCPRCDARMNYAPDGQTLRCDYCGYTQSPDQKEPVTVDGRFGQGTMEQDFVAGLATARGHLPPVNMRVLQCQRCAVEFTLSPETLSLTCPYCDSVYVTEAAETQAIMPPTGLVPFALSLDEAEGALRNWFKQHKILPTSMTAVTGIYLPVWTFDLSGELGWSGYVHDGDDWVWVTGDRPIIEDDILVLATEKLTGKLVKGMGDFDLNQVAPYDASYLANWPAERYQLPLADASLHARQQVLAYYREKSYILTDGRNTRDFRLKSTNLFIESFKLILLPVWLAHYRVEESEFAVLVNGQNGRVWGTRPQN
ncbi:MAG: hypothetical protein ACE5EY_18345, partial [Anaerolineae bacterium]